MEAIPSIICDTLYSLGLHDQTPSWKIMDNKGRITVVLHWEPDDLAALKGDYELNFGAKIQRDQIVYFLKGNSLSRN